MAGDGVIKVQGAQLHWKAQPFVKEVGDIVESRMGTAAAFLRTEIVKSISTSSRGAGPSKPGQPPHADTGHLRRSIFHDVVKTKESVKGIVGTTAGYGVALEFGATILPKKAKALTIPITKKAGKYPAKKFPGELVMIWPKGSNHGYLVEQFKKKTVIHYILAGKVTLAPRPFLRPGLAKNWNQIVKIITTGGP